MAVNKINRNRLKATKGFSILDQQRGITVGEINQTINEVNKELGIAGAGPVSSVFNRVGNVVSNTGDYTASQITNSPSGTISSNNVQDAINEISLEGQLLSQKGLAGGYAPLDGNGRVPALNLPAFVDDILEYADLASFPGTGESGKIYVALDNGKIYRWSGSTYTEIAATEVNSVYGRTGIISAQSGDYTANQVDFNTTVTGLAAGNVQEAIDLGYTESDNRITTLETASHNPLTLNISTPTQDGAAIVGQELELKLSTIFTNGLMSAADKTKLDNIETSATADQVATEVPITPSGNLTSNNVQDALVEIQTEVDSIDLVDSYTTSETLTNKTWIDSKSIYRKVVVPGTDLASPAFINAGIGGIYETITSIECITESSTHYVAESPDREVRYAKSANVITISDTGGVVRNPVIIIEYTKI